MNRRFILHYLQPFLIMVLTAIALPACYFIWEDVKEQQFLDLIRTSKIVASYEDLKYRNRELGLESVGFQLLAEVDEKKKAEIANNTLEILDELAGLSLLDKQGNLIYLHEDSLTKSLCQSLKASYSLDKLIFSFSKKGIFLGDPVYADKSYEWMIPIFVPLHDEKNNLIAVTSSFLPYNEIIENLNSIDFNKEYQIHLVSDVSRSTIVYYPLSDRVSYDSLLGKDARVYQDCEITKIGSTTSKISCYDLVEKEDIIGVEVYSEILDGRTIISVSRDVIITSFLYRSKYVLLAYLILNFIGLVTIRYLKSTETSHRKAIETEKANLKSMFESTKSIIGLFDINKRLIEFNGSFKKYLKASDNMDLEVGMDVFGQMENRKVARVISSYLDRVLTGEKFHETVEYLDNEGEVSYFRLNFNPILNGKEVVGISMFADNITSLTNSQKQLEKYSEQLESLVKERTRELSSANDQLKMSYDELNYALEELKKTQNQMIQSEKMASLGTLAAGVAHEINNPLNFIQGGAATLIQRIEDENVDVKPLEPFIHAINEGIDRCSAIVESLSNYSRKGGDLSEECNIHAILDNCLLILSSRLKRIEVSKDYGDNVRSVMGNEGQLHQVFLNILSNAEQAISGKGKICIMTTAAVGYIQIKIRDSGKGISEEILPKISDPFFTTKPPGQGTGLGLSIVYSIVEEHNGKIYCSSSTGKGTEFVIELPVFNLNVD